jgi:uncharacterized protein (TIGR02596 family)
MNTPCQSEAGKGFSLLEILAVIAIIAMVAVLTTPAISSALQAGRLNNAIALVSDEAALARQAAIANNRRVEVRFYRIPAEGGDAANPVFRALQTVMVSPSGEETTLAPLKVFPYPIEISDKTGETTLLRTDYQQTGSLPGRGNVPYNWFSFLPSGRTDLAPGTNWYLTIYNPREAATNGLPANFATIQIDPFTGHTKIYRP